MNNERLKILLYNAIIWIEEECADFFTFEVDDKNEWLEETLNISKEEYKEIMEG